MAENYYKGFQDSDGILHEKDGTISKLSQFDYKVHSLIKSPKEKIEKLEQKKERIRER